MTINPKGEGENTLNRIINPFMIWAVYHFMRVVIG